MANLNWSRLGAMVLLCLLVAGCRSTSRREDVAREAGTPTDNPAPYVLGSDVDHEAMASDLIEGIGRACAKYGPFPERTERTERHDVSDDAIRAFGEVTGPLTPVWFTTADAADLRTLADAPIGFAPGGLALEKLGGAVDIPPVNPSDDWGPQIDETLPIVSGDADRYWVGTRGNNRGHQSALLAFAEVDGRIYVLTDCLWGFTSDVTTTRFVSLIAPELGLDLRDQGAVMSAYLSLPVNERLDIVATVAPEPPG